MEGRMERAGRTVGIGLDYSASSKSAVRWVATHFARPGDRIILINSQPGKPDPHHQDASLLSFKEMKEPDVQTKYGILPDAYIFDLLENMIAVRGVEVMYKVYWGDPREVLVGAVDDLNLNTIVLGSRGLGMLKSLVLGSVSNHVVNHARCPVTVVKNPPLKSPRKR